MKFILWTLFLATSVQATAQSQPVNLSRPREVNLEQFLSLDEPTKKKFLKENFTWLKKEIQIEICQNEKWKEYKSLLSYEQAIGCFREATYCEGQYLEFAGKPMAEHAKELEYCTPFPGIPKNDSKAHFCVYATRCRYTTKVDEPLTEALVLCRYDFCNGPTRCHNDRVEPTVRCLTEHAKKQDRLKAEAAKRQGVVNGSAPVK